jgi:hypothetical protein
MIATRIATKCAPWTVAALALAAVLSVPAPAAAQAAIQQCSSAEPDKTNLPPSDSPPLYRCLELVFHPIDQPSIDTDTYLFYIKNKQWSLRSQNLWVPYREDAFLEDFNALWRTPLYSTALSIIVFAGTCLPRSCTV